MNAVPLRQSGVPVSARRRKSTMGAVAIVLGLVLSAALVVAGPAAAASRGFKVENKSSVDLELITAKPTPTVVCNGVTRCVESHYPTGFEGRPADGSSLPSGGSDTWELKYGFSPFGGVQYSSNLWYKIAGTDDTVSFTIETYSTTNESSCKVFGTSKYTCSAAGTKLEFKDN
jgi:hypothetical protein